MAQNTRLVKKLMFTLCVGVFAGEMSDDDSAARGFGEPSCPESDPSRPLRLRVVARTDGPAMACEAHTLHDITTLLNSRGPHFKFESLTMQHNGKPLKRNVNLREHGLCDGDTITVMPALFGGANSPSLWDTISSELGLSGGKTTDEDDSGEQKSIGFGDDRDGHETVNVDVVVNEDNTIPGSTNARR